MSNAGASAPAGTTKERARSSLSRLQRVTGVLLLLSSGAGIYLLYSDASLWLLAVSHAVGLVVIVVMDVLLGLMNMASARRVYLPTLASAVLAIALQLGDILTAPQYSMTMSYFASYLFGLWAFDALLVLQTSVLLLGYVGRPHAVYLARRKSRRGRELDYTRRGFLRSIIGLSALVAAGVLLGSIKIPSANQGGQSGAAQNGLPSGAIANLDSLKPGSTLTFEYPTGYPNILVMKTDGTLDAHSLLCTHVCCECEYVQSSGAIECPCHGSVFDLGGNVLRGPAIVALPAVQLRTDSSGNVFPVGVSSPGPCQV